MWARYLSLNSLHYELEGEFDGDESYVFEAAHHLALLIDPALYEVC